MSRRKPTGSKMLNDKELATIANRLQAPLIISDIMAGECELTGDVQYGLHSLISDLQVDSALLCIALGGLKIANGQHKASLSISILKLQCESIVNDYAAHWLQNSSVTGTDSHDMADTMSCIAEDLEGLSELLDMTLNALAQGKNEPVTSLIKILSIQAKAQTAIAEEFSDILSAKAASEATAKPQILPLIAKELACKPSGKVISFRGKRA